MARDWTPDVLPGFERTTLERPASYDGPVDAVLVRRRSERGNGCGVLYLHGFIDYFFQAHLADFYRARGMHFYALDLRRHGRALRPHQVPNGMRSIDEFLGDVAAALDVLEAEEGIDGLLLNGHSTGGLVAALYAHRGAGRERVDAVFLNSPFLDMNIPGWQERTAEPILAALGRVLPSLPLPGVSPLYGESLHASRRGTWHYDLAWKPIGGFAPRAGWFRAIHRAQAEVAAGLAIPVPVLVLHAERSRWPRGWSEEVRTADVVLDVADIERLAPRLGTDVRVGAIPDAVHDLTLSSPPAREILFTTLGEWLDEVEGVETECSRQPGHSK